MISDKHDLEPEEKKRKVSDYNQKLEEKIIKWKLQVVKKEPFFVDATDHDRICVHIYYNDIDEFWGVYWGENHEWNYTEKMLNDMVKDSYPLFCAIYHALKISNENGKTKLMILTTRLFPIKCFKEYIFKWKHNGFITSNNKSVQNKEIIKKIDDFISENDLNVDYRFKNLRWFEYDIKISSELMNRKVNPIEKEECGMKFYVDENDSDRYIVYTDGACLFNGKPYAKAGLGIYWFKDHPWNKSERLVEGRITNIESELNAILRAIQIGHSHNFKKLTIFSDSLFSIKCLKYHMEKWRSNNYELISNGKARNQTTLRKIENFVQENDMDMDYIYVRSNKNKNADRLATDAIKIYKLANGALEKTEKDLIEINDKYEKLKDRMLSLFQCDIESENEEKVKEQTDGLGELREIIRIKMKELQAHENEEIKKETNGLGESRKKNEIKLKEEKLNMLEQVEQLSEKIKKLSIMEGKINKNGVGINDELNQVVDDLCEQNDKLLDIFDRISSNYDLLYYVNDIKELKDRIIVCANRIKELSSQMKVERKENFEDKNKLNNQNQLGQYADEVKVCVEEIGFKTDRNIEEMDVSEEVNSFAEDVERL